MFGLINRGQLPDKVLQEFENLVARLREFLLKEHNEDGTHRTSIAAINYVPVGGILHWAASAAPTGWVLCQGQQLSRLTYKALFDVIGTTYGAGDGSTTFNVPDSQGRFLLNKASAGTGNALAGTGGALDHTHTGGATSSDGSHDHGGSTGSAGAHTHTFTTGVNNNDANVTHTTEDDLVANNAHIHSGTTDSDGAHSHSISSAGAHTHTSPTTGSNNPAYIVVNAIIFTGVS